MSPSPVWRPYYVEPDDEIRVAYLSPSQHVIDYYGNRYLRQSQGHELIGFDNFLLDPQVFDVHRFSRSVLDIENRSLPVVYITARARGGGEWAVMYHYRIGDRLLSSALAAQLTAGFDAIWGPVQAGVHAVAAPCLPDCESIRDELAVLLARLPRDP